MTEKYTPEKVAELVTEALMPWREGCDGLIVTLADALAAVSADRLRKGIAEALAERMTPEEARILRAALDKEGSDDGRV